MLEVWKSQAIVVSSATSVQGTAHNHAEQRHPTYKANVGAEKHNDGATVGAVTTFAAGRLVSRAKYHAQVVVYHQ